MSGHRFNPENAHKLDNPERRKVFPPESILLEFGIQSTDTVLDIGAGTGYFAIPATNLCQTVCALDVEPKMLNLISEKLQNSNISNMELIQGEMENIPMEPNSVTKVIASLILHETADLTKTLSEMYRVMKKGSDALIIDWEKKEMEQGPPYEERLDKEELKTYITSTGFQIKDTKDIEDTFYMLIISK